MKVYISGSKFIGSNYWKDDIPAEAFTKVLDEIIEKEEDVIVCDYYGVDEVVQYYLHDKAYKNVTVYVAGKKTRKNIGNWKEKHCITADDANRFRYFMDKETAAFEDADYGIIAWDGEDNDSYAEMLYLAYQGKKCRLYLMSTEVWIDICSLEDLRPYAGELARIEDEDIKTVLDICGFSEEMKTFLVDTESISDYGIVDVIYNAPIALKKKLNMFRDLLRKRNRKKEYFDLAESYQKEGCDFNKLIKAFRTISSTPDYNCVWNHIQGLMDDMAMVSDRYFKRYDAWEIGAVYSLFSEWYDTDVYMEKSSSDGLFSYASSVFEYIENEEREMKEQSDCESNSWWNRVEYWLLDDEDDSLKHKYDFYIFNGDVCWYEEKEAREQDNGNTYYMKKHKKDKLTELDLNLKTPFKTGDIVLIDCSPFGPPFHAVVLESHNQYDCCFPNIVFKVPYTNDWRCAPLKHMRFYKDAELSFYRPKLSPLYRIRTVLPNEMTKEDESLLTIKALLSADEEKAKKIWRLWGCEDKTYEQVIEIITGADNLMPDEKKDGDTDGDDK